jgi:hypothetical protein
MYTVWHVDKYKITFKLVINWTNEILQHTVVFSGLSLPGIVDARARYRAAARRLRNTALKDRVSQYCNACLPADIHRRRSKVTNSNLEQARYLLTELEI